MDDLERFRREKDAFLRGHPQSPLTPEQKRHFKGLNYFPESPDLELEVEVEEFPEKRSIQMQTSTGDVQSYQRHGRFKFEVEGQQAWLTLYSGEHGFFLPFADSLAGQETYGAGRYLEPEPQGGARFSVNFNLAYNPFCAYNPNWSCPLTPFENRVNVPIRAGEMVFPEASQMNSDDRT